jgi:hypothetical protein
MDTKFVIIFIIIIIIPYCIFIYCNIAEYTSLRNYDSFVETLTAAPRSLSDVTAA